MAGRYLMYAALSPEIGIRAFFIHEVPVQTIAEAFDIPGTDP